MLSIFLSQDHNVMYMISYCLDQWGCSLCRGLMLSIFPSLDCYIMYKITYCLDQQGGSLC